MVSLAFWLLLLSESPSPKLYQYPTFTFSAQWSPSSASHQHCLGVAPTVFCQEVGAWVFSDESRASLLSLRPVNESKWAVAGSPNWLDHPIGCKEPIGLHLSSAVVTGGQLLNTLYLWCCLGLPCYCLIPVMFNSAWLLPPALIPGLSPGSCSGLYPVGQITHILVPETSYICPEGRA